MQDPLGELLRLVLAWLQLRAVTDCPCAHRLLLHPRWCSPTASRPSFAQLAPQLAGQAVIEEVFENQRLQPFRGWGHTWPGRWSRAGRAGGGEGGWPLVFPARTQAQEACQPRSHTKPHTHAHATPAGHFLPTDRVSHWSRRENDNFPVLAGQDFQAIAPPLPEVRWGQGSRVLVARLPAP